MPCYRCWAVYTRGAGLTWFFKSSAHPTLLWYTRARPQVTPSNLTTSPVSVSVTWSGVAGAQSTDWIATYCVGQPEPNWQGTWLYVNACSSWQTGSCTISSWNLDYSTFNCPTIEFRMYRLGCLCWFICQNAISTGHLFSCRVFKIVYRSFMQGPVSVQAPRHG